MGMRHLLELVLNTNHTNVMVMSAPHRHDLMGNSCVNKGTEKFNRKIRSRLERLGNVEMIEVGNGRNLYTRHGQHLNTEGKKDMTKKIASAMQHVLSNWVEPITGMWYIDKATDTLDHQPAQGMADNNTEVETDEHSNTPAGLDTLKIPPDIVDRKSPKKTQKTARDQKE